MFHGRYKRRGSRGGMCVCGSCWLIVGCRNYRRRISTPSGYMEPPARIHCLGCGEIAHGMYIVDEQRCHCCFIPCCCTRDTSDPMLACSKCYLVYGSTPKRCRGCQVYTAMKTNFCANCGTEMTVSNTEEWDGGHGPGNNSANDSAHNSGNDGAHGGGHDSGNDSHDNTQGSGQGRLRGRLGDGHRE